jgi:putative acetyltransferase
VFLDIHHAAVRGLAAHDYPASVIDSWAPMPISVEAMDAFEANPADEIRVIAELDEATVGIGVLAPESNEIRACYVRPDAVRQGIGTAIVRELERAAQARGLDHLHLSASLTAERFYLALGYRVMSRGEHVLQSGERMAAVFMERSLVRPG